MPKRYQSIVSLVSLAHTTPIHLFFVTEEKLAESTAANAALSAQLENLSPQISNLETSLSASRQKVKEEQALRRQAEQKQDEADQRVRELEQSIQTLREECDAVHEELAFKENELEETRLELEVEMQQLENEAGSLKEALANAQAASRHASSADSVTADDATTATSAKRADSSAEDDAYVKKLEEELELVTEQLIDTENRLLQAENDLADRDRQIMAIQENESTIESESIQLLTNEKDDLVERESALRKELAVVTEELSLSREEVQLLQEEQQNGEHSLGMLRETLEKDRHQHKEDVKKLEEELEESRINLKAAQGELAILTASIHETNSKNDDLIEQIAGLECALSNVKTDYEGVLSELNDVNVRFDEARIEAEQVGRESAAEELKAAMKVDSDHEIQGVKEALKKLSDENQALQEKVDAAEIALAKSKDNDAADSSQNEAVSQLQAQLDRSKALLAEKEKEMGALSSNLEARVDQAEARVCGLESELHAAKGKLAETEAHLIVLRREMANAVPVKVEHINGDAGKHDSSGRESPSDLIQQLSEETKKFQALEQNYTELQDQKRMSDIRIKRLEDELKALQKQLFGGEAGVVTQMSRISSLGQKHEAGLLIEEKKADNLDELIESRDLKKIGEEMKSLQQRFNSQREYNAQLLSRMLHFQGNIQVYCRIRPISGTELQKGAQTVVESLSETEVGCFDTRTKKWKSFAFDRVWGPDQTQTSVFQDVEPLALSVVDGFNACIFCYGQTGSGYVACLFAFSTNQTVCLL
jgi:kinesin family member C2/C3